MQLVRRALQRPQIIPQRARHSLFQRPFRRFRLFLQGFQHSSAIMKTPPRGVNCDSGGRFLEVWLGGYVGKLRGHGAPRLSVIVATISSWYIFLTFRGSLPGKERYGKQAPVREPTRKRDKNLRESACC